jgi:hypothetical protein
MMSPETVAHTEIVSAMLTLAGMLGSGIGWILRRQTKSLKLLIEGAERQARIELKVDTMWAWFTNHGSDITGYKKEQQP